MKKTISVICPVRNMQGRLQNLRSWVSECTDDFQLIFVCDSSTDNTQVELNAIRKSNPDKNIEILLSSFGNPGSARNLGLKVALGTWIIFWDSDDVAFPRVLLNEIEMINADNVDAIIFGYDVYSGTDAVFNWGHWPLEESKCKDIVSLSPGIWRFCFKRQSLTGFEFPALRMAEDQLMLNSYFQKLPRLRFSNSTIYRYFANVEGQLTKSSFALKDLSSAATVLSKQIRSESVKNTFSIRMYGRILLTSLYRGSLDLKLKSGLKFCILFIKFPRVMTKLLNDIKVGKV